MPGELQVKVEPWGPDPDRIEEAARSAVRQPAVRAELGDAEARLVGLQPVDAGDEPVPPRSVRAKLYDYAEERALLVDVPLDEGGRDADGLDRPPAAAERRRAGGAPSRSCARIPSSAPRCARAGSSRTARCRRWPARSCPTAASSAS